MQICELYLYDDLCCALLWYEKCKQFDTMIKYDVICYWNYQ